VLDLLELAEMTTKTLIQSAPASVMSAKHASAAAERPSKSAIGIAQTDNTMIKALILKNWSFRAYHHE
jgi:hypothetical protein